jgi:hypothetical protein
LKGEIIMSKFVEVIKANKGLVKKALIIGGGALGLAIVARAVASKNDENLEEAEVACDDQNSNSDEN